MATDRSGARYETRRGQLQSVLRWLLVLLGFGIATPAVAGVYSMTGAFVAGTAIVFLWVFYTATAVQLTRLFEAV